MILSRSFIAGDQLGDRVKKITFAFAITGSSYGYIVFAQGAEGIETSLHSSDMKELEFIIKYWIIEYNERTTLLFLYRNTLYKASNPKLGEEKKTKLDKNIPSAYDGQQFKVLLYHMHEAYMKMVILIYFVSKLMFWWIYVNVIVSKIILWQSA